MGQWLKFGHRAGKFVASHRESQNAYVNTTRGRFSNHVLLHGSVCRSGSSRKCRFQRVSESSQCLLSLCILQVPAYISRIGVNNSACRETNVDDRQVRDVRLDTFCTKYSTGEVLRPSNKLATSKSSPEKLRKSRRRN